MLDICRCDDTLLCWILLSSVGIHLGKYYYKNVGDIFFWEMLFRFLKQY